MTSAPPTSRALPLLKGEITYDDAVDKDDNMLQKIAYPQQREEFYLHLYCNRHRIESIVSFHLCLSKTQTCRIGEFKEWVSGSFNVCIPVYIDHRVNGKKRVLIRFPLPYKVGELQNPGNADEKLRCEAATFIWIRDNCPDVPIPHLWAFGFSNGLSFTVPENVSIWRRFNEAFWRVFFSLSGRPLPCRYVRRSSSWDLGVGYLIMDYIEREDGRFLSESWAQLHNHTDRRVNLFRGLARIMLSLSRSPLPRIGSWTINDEGVLSLTNRPLTLQLQALENEGIPTGIDRGLTYSAAESYYIDLLACHDRRIRHQPNAVSDYIDGQAQLAALTILRALLPVFSCRELRHGPFVLTLTDLHQSNIVVDDDWHIKCILDLEWACSLPIEMQQPPHWLTDRGTDELEDEHLEAFGQAYKEFTDIFEEEAERSLSQCDDISYRTNIMRKGWEKGSFWYFLALEDTKGLYNIFVQHIQPMFARLHRTETTFDEQVAPYWSTDAAQVLADKIKDREKYQNELWKAFNTGTSHGQSG